jgi:hypothetical protein
VRQFTAPPAHVGLEARDELLGEVHREVPDPVQGERTVRSARAVLAPELGVAVVERRRWWASGDGDRGAVGHG